MLENDVASRLVERAFTALPAPAMLTNADRVILKVNRGFEELTGWRDAEIVGRSTTVLRGPRTDAAASRGLAEAMAGGRGWHGELLTYRKDGEPFLDLVSFRRIDGVDDLYFVGTLQDHSEAALLRSVAEERGQSASRMLELAGRLGFTAGRPEIARIVAESMTQLGAGRCAVALAEGEELRVRGTAGWEMGPQSLDGSKLALRPADLGATVSTISLLDPSTGIEVPAWLAPIIRDDTVLGAVVVDPEECVDAPEFTARLVRVAGLASTALDNLAALDELREAAERDPLTGLLTHDGLLRRFADRLDRAPRVRFVGSARLVLEHFRRVNEAFGYAAGDRLLQLIADRIGQAVGPDVLTARHGSNEFLLATADLDSLDGLSRLLDRLEPALGRPVVVDGHTIYPTITSGRAARRRGKGPAAALAAGLAQAADTETHAERDRRRSRLPVESSLDLLQLDTALHAALERGELVAHFQPQYALATGRLTGFEALARWRSPDLGQIAPDVFIALAEDNGLIHELGRLMLAHGRRFLATQPVDTTLHVNVSTRQLARPGFARLVATEFAEDPTLLTRLVLEVTESTLILDYDRVAGELQELRRQGVGVSVDDFGSGYSSLFQLQELPATELKIDKVFVQRAGAIGTSILEAVIGLARSLHLEVVAEGVETEEQLAMLRRLGCDRAQGYLFSPALPADMARSVCRSLPVR